MRVRTGDIAGTSQCKTSRVLREHISATLKNDDITTPSGSRSGLDGVFLFRNVKSYAADTNPFGRQHEKAASCGVLKTRWLSWQCNNQCGIFIHKKYCCFYERNTGKPLPTVLHLG
jgi:hypothetical protein